MEEEGPIVQGGHDVPGLSSMSGRDRRGYNPIDRDEDVVAQQRQVPPCLTRRHMQRS